MLWNWETVDACFIDSSWQISSKGMFAGCCIGVICLVITLEFLRRVGREYDAYILRRHSIRQQIQANPTSRDNNNNESSSSSSSPAPKPATATTTTPLPDSTAANNNSLLSILTGGNTGIDGRVRPSLFDQLVRALLHMTQFAVAYFIMLLAMYYNGYFIICIFIGAFIGSFIFAWEPLGAGKELVLSHHYNVWSKANLCRIDACAVTKCCG